MAFEDCLFLTVICRSYQSIFFPQNNQLRRRSHPLLSLSIPFLFYILLPLLSPRVPSNDRNWNPFVVIIRRQARRYVAVFRKLNMFSPP